MRPPFFHALNLQLLEPPPATRAALVPAALLVAPPPAPRAAAAVSIARRWLKALLRKPLAPRAENPFVAFAAEAGRADVVRSVWGAGPSRVEMAQTKYLIAVKVHRDVDPGEPVERRVEAAATTLFQTSAPLSFVRLGEDETGVFGRRDLGRPPTQKAWPHWLDSMHFWTKDTRIGFVTLRASGGATREFISADETINRAWFDAEP